MALKSGTIFVRTPSSMWMRHKWTIVSFLFNSPPPMYPRGLIYNPLIGSEGSSWSVSRHMEGQRSSYFWLYEEKSKIFIFGHISRCTRVIVGQVACTRGMQACYPCIEIIRYILRVFLEHQSIFWGKGVQRVHRRTWKAIKVWSTKCGKISYNTHEIISTSQGTLE